jgi:hypothetical protein
MSARSTFLILACLLVGCARLPQKVETSSLFREVASESGLDFHHFNGATGGHYLPEITGSGVALFDYDGDGDLDILLIQGDFVEPGHQLGDATYPPPAGWKPGCRLFRNELIPGGKLRFTDVTKTTGIQYRGMGMGAAVGDYDNDGHPDVLLTGFGHSTLFHNNGDGTFSDITKTAGIEDPGWSSSAAFIDYDRDGKLDLFVAHYLDFPLTAKQCATSTGETEYCAPSNFRPTASQLYHNQGRGRFRDVSAVSGIAAARGSGLGVTAADLDGDGWADLYVANDGVASHLWINRHDGTFREAGVESGAAFSMHGKTQAGMGIAAGDFDNDGDEDLFKTNFSAEGSNLYRNDGKGLFVDIASETGILGATLRWTGFGAGWFDFDNDGWLDLVTANGSVSVVEAQRGTPFPYRQPNVLLHSERGRAFSDVTTMAGASFQKLEVSRGLAFGDLDNDGRMDLVISTNNGPVRLYLNQTPVAGHWLEVKLEGVRSNRDGAGANVTVTRSDGIKLRRRAHSDGSFLSASDIRVHFGLGTAALTGDVLVEWPEGTAETFSVPGVDRIVTLKQGAGRAGR